jgi:hypothetical protein
MVFYNTPFAAAIVGRLRTLKREQFKMRCNFARHLVWVSYIPSWKTSDIWHLTSDTWHLTSEIWYLTSDIYHLTSYIWHLTSGFWYLTSDIWHLTFDIRRLTAAQQRRAVLIWTPTAKRKRGSVISESTAVSHHWWHEYMHRRKKNATLYYNCYTRIQLKVPDTRFFRTATCWVPSLPQHWQFPTTLSA